MITEYFWPELEDIDLDDMWFQQDGDANHTAHDTIDLLKSKFDERVISRNGPLLYNILNFIFHIKRNI